MIDRRTQIVGDGEKKLRKQIIARGRSVGVEILEKDLSWDTRKTKTYILASFGRNCLLCLYLLIVIICCGLQCLPTTVPGPLPITTRKRVLDFKISYLYPSHLQTANSPLSREE